MLPERVAVGKVVGAHGVRGTLRVAVLTDFPERFRSMEELSLFGRGDRALGSFPVTRVRPVPGKNQMLIDCEGIDTRDDAEALTGAQIKVPRSDCPVLPEGTYWIDDLLGLEVVEAETGRVLGRLDDVMQTGAADVYVVTGGDGRLLLPAVGEVVRSVDLRQRRMEVSLPEGLPGR
ncbi:MAG: ribosome maturation factor RimM [Synergistales bacterium]|nr:ribosome maturation factor RimM [Synergistales bacterium]